MSALLIYLTKVIVIQGILFLIYRLVFHKSGRFDLNRGFIFSALIFSLIIPLVDASSMLPDRIEEEHGKARVWLEAVEFELTASDLTPVKKIESNNSVWFYAPWLLLGISLLLFIRSIVGYFQLTKMLSQSVLIRKGWYNLYRSKMASPFSFFKNILMPDRLFDDASAFDQVLAHEAIHVKKWHSIDRAILELMICVFWFNPMIYHFRRVLIETHEFQADESVILQFKDSLSYQEVLYQQLTTSSPAGMVNHFNYSTIKNRIKMMNKMKKKPLWLYSFTLPAILALVLTFSNNSAPEKLTSEVVTPISDVFSPTEQYRPSIFPLKNSVSVKMTSGFGNRMHPVLKKEIMHNGMDLKTKEGNPVLATANGIVSFAGEDGDYGIKISIDHNGLYETVYAHLAELSVKSGDKVKRGDMIALSGSTGRSSSPHLHYEVIETENGHVDPLEFIDDYKFDANQKVSNETVANSTSKTYKVVIDPGHGGADNGVGSSHLFEKEIVLNIASKVAANFSGSQIEVILTRKDDRLVTLKDRMLQTEGADLFISLHVEEHTDKNQDFMMPAYLENGKYEKKSQRFAKLLAYEFGQKDKEVNVAYTNGYYVLKNAKCPAVLFHIGMVSNLNADRYLNSEKGQAEIAKELSDAIELAVL